MTADVPVLRTEHFVLRPFSAADTAAYVALHADREVMQQVAEGQPLSSSQAWAQLAFHIGQWTLRGYGTWAIEDAADGRFAGRVGFLHPPELDDPELGLLLDRPWQGRGNGREVCVAAFGWIFSLDDIERVTSWIKPGNRAAGAIAGSLGAVKTGTGQRHGATFDLWTFTPGTFTPEPGVSAHPPRVEPSAPPRTGWRLRRRPPD